MAVDSSNARIFGSDNDAVHVGPLGTTLPTAPDEALDPDLIDTGWLHPDGIEFTPGDSVEQFRGHQGARIIRTKITESGTQFMFQCLESKAAVLDLQHNVIDHTDTAGPPAYTTHTLSPSRRVAPRAFVIDVYDDDTGLEVVQDRYVIPRGEIGERQSFTLANSDIVGFTFNVEIIGDFFKISTDPGAFAA